MIILNQIFLKWILWRNLITFIRISDAMLYLHPKSSVHCDLRHPKHFTWFRSLSMYLWFWPLTLFLRFLNKIHWIDHNGPSCHTFIYGSRIISRGRSIWQIGGCIRIFNHCLWDIYWIRLKKSPYTTIQKVNNGLRRK